ncbi:MAG: GEVED domain-containing protein, partial [Planctomycetota bacterium]
NYVTSVSTGIIVYEIDPATPTALRAAYYNGVEFEALVHDPNNTGSRGRFSLAVGNVNEVGPVQFGHNLVYLLDSNGTAVNHPWVPSTPHPDGARLTSNIVPVGQLYSAPTIISSYATQIVAPYNLIGPPANQAGDIEDGDWFRVYDDLGASQPFEFDFGTEYRAPAGTPSGLRDGDWFSLEEYLTGTPYEFEFSSGPVIQINSSSNLNFDVVTIHTSATTDARFAFDDTTVPGVPTGATAVIQVNPGMSLGAIASALATAISANTSFIATAVGNRVSLENEFTGAGNPGYADVEGGAAEVTISGNYIVTGGRNAISFEETWTGVEFATQYNAQMNATLIGLGSSIRTGYAYRAPDANGQSPGDRVSFLNTRLPAAWDPGSLTQFNLTANWTYRTGAPDVTAGRIAIPVTAADTDITVAGAMTTAINSGAFNVVASWRGATVELTNVNTTTPVSGLGSTAPTLNIEGAGVGGNITGMAYVGGQMFAVSDTGGLYGVSNWQSATHSGGSWGFSPVSPTDNYNYIRRNVGGGPQLNFITQVQYDGTAIQFSGLSAGPLNVEGGRYADTLFATDLTGHLYALDSDGNLRPVFEDSADRLQLEGNPGGGNLTGVRGVDFSPIDYNLWHMTRNRWADAGHGVEQTDDQTRSGELFYRVPGDYSMYFGLEDPGSGDVVDRDLLTGAYMVAQPGAWNFDTSQNSAVGDAEAYWSYNLPGGAYGTFSTNTFSLQGYSAQDEPVLYFTYLAETEGTLNYDSTRVYISNDGASWEMIATNTDIDDGGLRADYQNGIERDMQTARQPDRIVDEIVDSNGFRAGTWRQARVDLSRYAGLDNLRLRFDFSTASDMEINNEDHAYLAAVPATWLIDGETFTIVDRTLNPDREQVFEFDLGYSLVMPNTAGRTIGDGEWFEIDDGANTVRFEFDKNSDVVESPTLRAVSINDNMSTVAVAQEIRSAILGSVLDIATVLDDASDQNAFGATTATRIFLTRAVDVTQSGGAAVIIQGDAPGTVTPGRTRVPLTGDVSQREVAEVITQVVNQQFLRWTDLNDGVAGFVDTTAPDRIQALAPSALPNGRTFLIGAVTQRGDYSTVTFEFQRTGLGPQVVNATRVIVDLQGIPNTDAIGVADAIAQAVNAAGTPGSLTDLDLGASAAGEVATLNGPVSFFAGGSSGLVLLNYDGPIIRLDTNSDGVMDLQAHTASGVGQLGYSESLRTPPTFAKPSGSPVDNPSWKNYGGTRTNNRFNLFERGQNNRHEGFYIDDIIIGFAERGELITNAGADGARTDFSQYGLPNLDFGEFPIITVGDYQLEVRTGTTYGSYLGPFPVNIITRTFDTNDRLAEGWTIMVPAAGEIYHGQEFEIYDGINRQTFVFLDDVIRGGGGDDKIAIYFNSTEDAGNLSIMVGQAINQAYQDGKLNVTAKYIDSMSGDRETSNRIDLTGAVAIVGDVQATVDVQSVFYYVEGWDSGDANLVREKGQIIIEANSVMYSGQYGIVVAPSSRDTGAQYPHPGSGRSIKVPNDLVTGVMIENNLVAFSGIGGIRFSGQLGEPDGAVPFGRIVNNTIYGPKGTNPAGTGIRVENNASPTLLNNIVANLNVGVSVDAGSVAQGTVISGTVYQRNNQNVVGMGVGDFARSLAAGEPLFVNPAGENFYLAPGSAAQPNRAVDSAVDSLEERQGFFNAILNPIGIPLSPILAPNLDLYGQKRKDDPGNPGGGVGLSADKDRGAIDRVDFKGPTAWLIDPLDNEAGVDRSPQQHTVSVVGVTLNQFTIQLRDTGVGIADRTVVAPTVWVYQNLASVDELVLPNPPQPLIEQLDYFFVYNSVNDVITLTPAAGVWSQGSTYTVILDNQTIRDLAGNLLQPNHTDGPVWTRTRFLISLSGLDFGDAPDDGNLLDAPPNYPSLLATDGARHVVLPGYSLGARVNSESDSKQTGTGDQFDDGLVIGGLLVKDPTNYIGFTVTATGGDGYLDAWIDYDADGAWQPDEKLHVWTDLDNDGLSWDDDPGDGEQEYDGVSIPLAEGENSFFLVVDQAQTQGIDVYTWGRFRFSSTGGLTTTGEADDGEVEDHQLGIVTALRDFGDAPNSYLTRIWDGIGPVRPDGPSHKIDGLYLGFGVDDEIDGQPTPDATGDDVDTLVNDEDGITVLPPGTFIAGAGQEFDAAGNYIFGTADYIPAVQLQVTSSIVGAYLQAWIDFDQNGSFAGLGEQVLTNYQLDHDNDGIVANTDIVEINVPWTAKPGNTIARFRLSTTPGLKFYDEIGVGPALDGEVEDYQVLIVQAALDFGDAPAGIYPTLEADDGARHGYAPPINLGALIDVELDAAWDANATGDDLDNLSDEDGIRIGALDPADPLFGKLKAGTGNWVYVDASWNGYLNAWADFDDSGDWDGSFTDADSNVWNEHFLVNTSILAQPLLPGDPSFVLDGGRWWQKVAVEMPEGLNPVTSFARFRFTSEAPVDPSYMGLYPDGEVEDYQFSIVVGDALISGWKFEDRNADGVWDIQGTSTRIDPVSLAPFGSGAQVLMSGRDSDGQLYTDVVPNDDLSSGLLDLGFSFEFFGNTYTQFFVNNNGNITFENALGRFIPQGFGQPTSPPIVAPFWADVDTRVDTNGNAGGEVSMTKGTSAASNNPFVQIDWVDVGFFDRTVVQVLAVPGSQIADGDSFTLSDGGPTLTFEFENPDDANWSDGVSFGTIAIDVDNASTPEDVAVAIAAAINAVIVPPDFAVWATAEDKVVTLNGVAQFDAAQSPLVDLTDMRNTRRNAFTLYIENDDSLGDIVVFDYISMDWTTGGDSGTDGFGGLGAQIGFDAGDATNYISLMRPNSTSTLSDLLQIEQYSFRIDPATGTPVEAEPGMAGIFVYLDLNDNGVRDTDQFNVLEPGMFTAEDNLATPDDDETGRYEFTGLFAGTYVVREILSDPELIQTYPNAPAYVPEGTLEILAVAPVAALEGKWFSVDDGTDPVFFEFDYNGDGNPLGNPTYVVLDVSGAGSADEVAAIIAGAIQSEPSLDLTASSAGEVLTITANAGATVQFSKGTTPLEVVSSFTNRVGDEGFYTVKLDPGEQFDAANFGNFRKPHITISDVSVLEGDVGETPVEVTVHVTGSFGATIELEYYTLDGTAQDGIPAGEDDDYEPVNPSYPALDPGYQRFLIEPHHTPLGVWNAELISVIEPEVLAEIVVDMASVDIVFLIDTSGSMDDDIQAVKDNLSVMDNYMQAWGL